MKTQGGLSALRRAVAFLFLAAVLIPVTLAAPTNFHAVAPCRVYDTRLPGDGPALQSGVTRTVTITGVCGVPSNASAVALNLTAVQPSAAGHLRLSPAGTAPSPVSAINFAAGRNRANNTIIQLSNAGAIDALPTTLPAGTVHLILDVYGYFVDDVPPTAADDAASLAEDAVATVIDVLANDSNPDGGGPIAIDTVTQPANGTVAIGPGGLDLSYQPAGDYCNAPPGSSLDTFTYTLAPGGSTATVTVTVSCVNDAPQVAGAGTVAFAEDGPPVVVAPALSLSDVDDTSLESAAVTITNLLDPGAELLAADTTGTAITAVYAAPTLTLSGSDSLANYALVLRRVTYENTDGSPDLTPRALSLRVNDGDADSNTDSATVNLTATNDAPVLAAGGGSPSFTEDGPAVAVDPALAVSDVDDTNLESAAVTITNLQDAGAEVLAAVTTGTAITAAYTAPVLTLSGSDTVANYQQVLRSVTYANTSQNPSAAPRSLTFVANDGALDSNTVTTVLAVAPVNDPPALTAGGGSPSFTEDGAAVAVDPGIAVADVDDTNLESATVTITNPQDLAGANRAGSVGSAELLAAVTTGTAITAVYNAPVLTLSGSDTVANYQQVLRSVTYSNGSQDPDPTPRAIAFVAHDGSDPSNTATTTVGVVPVNDAPVLAPGGGSPTFTEGGAPVTVDPGLALSDVDNASLASATVTITNLQDAGAEVLAATTTGTAITAAYVAPTLTLSGTDTLANYLQVLRSVTYTNGSETPSGAPRVVSFQATDGALPSNTVTTTVGVAAVDDAPVLTAGGGSPTFTEDGAAVAVDPGLGVSDADSANLASATVTITNLVDAGAELLSATTTGTAITAVYTAPTLTLTGSDTVANYRQVLRSVTYANTSQNPSLAPRSVAFQATDGTTASNVVSTLVGVAAVNDPPVLTAGGGSPSFTEDGAAVAVDPGLVVVDIDSGLLASATVTITNPQDLAAAINQAGTGGSAEILAATTTGTSITAVYNAPVLTLSGADSVANYQQVLRSVTYLNTSDSPSTTARVIAFAASDGAAGSNTVTTTVGVTAVNDAPVLTAGGASPSFTEDGPAVAVDAGLTVADGDSTDLASATVTITNLQDTGAETLAAVTAGTSIIASYTAPTLTLTGTDTLANYQQVLRSVAYSNASQNPGTTARSIAFQASDGTDNSNVAVTAVSVVRVNDPPVLGGAGSPTFTEDAGAVAGSPALTAVDVDNANLTSATVTITNLLDTGAEILTANTTGTSITAAYVAPTLTLSGSDTVANYQAVLRSVAYNNLSQNPTAATRSLAYVASDGAASSNTVTALVSVVPVNDPPVLTTNPISYATAGNTQLHVAGRTLAGVASIADPQSALTKSAPTDVDGPVAAVVVPATGTSGNGGSFDIASDGSFTYVPAAGFTGADSFTYQVTDTVTPTVGTINVTVGAVVWYVRDVVDASNPAGGDGRSTNAVETLPAAETASGANHFVFVFAGNSATTPYTPGIVLKDGQKLHGQGVGLSVPGFANIVATGAQPRVSAPVDAVSVPATAGARSNVEIRGLDLQGGTGNAIDVTASGANVVGVTISNNTVRGAGAEGIDLNDGSSGIFTATVQDNSIAATGNGFDARTSVAGASLRVAFSTNQVVSGATAVLVSGAGGGTAVVTGFSGNAVNGNTGGGGIQLESLTFDGVPGGTIDAVSGGNTQVGASGNPVGSFGVVLTNVSGRVDFSDLDVFATSTALGLTGTGAFNGTTGTQLTVTPLAGSLQTTAGAAASVSSATLDLRLSALSATGGGVSLTNVSDGTVAARFSAPAGSTITSTSGGAFTVSGGDAGVSYAGSIVNSGGRAVNVSSWSGDDASDDMLFSGSIDENGTGILLNGNGGSRSITFSGQLDVDPTGGNIGFSATSNTNAGGVHVTGSANTIDTSNAAALNVTSTAIGSGNLIFERLSASGGTSGIVLSNTGTAGGLTVSGAGTPGSGGVIQNMTSHGVSLTNTRNVSLSRLSITNNDGSGIDGDDVTNFTLSLSSVTNNADTATGVEANIRFQELLGTCTITGSTISGSSEDEIRITPTSGTLTNLTVSSSTIGPNSATTGGNGITLFGLGSATGTLTVTGTVFSGIRGTAVVSNFTSTGSHTVNVGSSTFRDNGKAVSLANNTATDMNFNVSGNTEIVRSLSNALELISSFDSTPSMQNSGTIGSNTVGNGAADSGSRDLHGIAIDLRGDERSVIAVNSNSVRNVDFNGIFFQDADFGSVSGAPSEADMTIRDNSIQQIDDNSGFPCGAPYGILVDMRHTTTACLDLFSNTSAESPAGCGAAHIRVRQRDTSTFQFERLSDGDGTPGELITSDLTVEAHIVGQSDAGTTADATLAPGFGFHEAATGACQKP